MKITPLISIGSLIVLLAGCAPNPSGTGGALAPQQVSASPTTASLLPTPEKTARPTAVCPNPDCIVARPPAALGAPLRLSLPTPADEPVSAWRPPQYPVPLLKTIIRAFLRPFVLNCPVAAHNDAVVPLLRPFVAHLNT